ncbi:MAG: RluA family pseudouridine synthase [Candidatus Faecousia sp.]|nr:RluA family pseudouridine synthase [Bacillota bacterium]MDY6041627.1 RluA family pseudouridine synthase [Candidatus Faecousia sp.]
MTLHADLPGERLDAFLARTVPELTRSAAQKLIESGNVLRNGRPGRKNDKLNPGEEISLTIPEPKEVDIVPREIPLDIVYEDEDVVVINKPKGLVVHPAAGHTDDTLVNGLLYALGDGLSGINGELRPGIVHRIDKDTSGLLAVAKNDLAHTVLASQLKDHTMARTYDAIVCGTMREDSGTVDAPIGRHPTDRKKMCVTERNSKPAVTHWEVVKRYRGYTHIRCHLETGRTHQIRVHMAYIGHPILGDMVYGHKKPELGQSSQCLHAGALCFRHPRDGRPVMVFAELPPYFKDVIEKLEKMGT